MTLFKPRFDASHFLMSHEISPWTIEGRILLAMCLPFGLQSNAFVSRVATLQRHEHRWGIICMTVVAAV